LLEPRAPTIDFLRGQAPDPADLSTWAQIAPPTMRLNVDFGVSRTDDLARRRGFPGLGHSVRGALARTHGRERHTSITPVHDSTVRFDRHLLFEYQRGFFRLGALTFFLATPFLPAGILPTGFFFGAEERDPNPIAGPGAAPPWPGKPRK
jgi:hypothetical protein